MSEAKISVRVIHKDGKPVAGEKIHLSLGWPFGAGTLITNDDGWIFYTFKNSFRSATFYMNLMELGCLAIADGLVHTFII